LGFASVIWAAAEERALVDAPDDNAQRPGWNVVVGASTLIAVAALLALAIPKLYQVEWTIIAVAIVAIAGFVGLRMWTGERAEGAYLDAVASGEKKDRALSAERAAASRLRGVSSLAGATAHEVNNLLQAI